MARINNLNNFLTDVASAIKAKTGLTAIKPENFDTAIQSISTGIEPHGTTKQYYVAAGKTVTAGDFVEIVNGTAYIGTGSSKLVTIYDGEPDGGNRVSGNGFKAWKINEQYVLLAFAVSITNGLFVMIGKIDNGTIILGDPMLISPTESKPSYMKLLSGNDIALCHGKAKVSFLHYEGYKLFFINEITIRKNGTVNAAYSENPNGTLNCMCGETKTYKTGITNTNVPTLDTALSFVKNKHGAYEDAGGSGSYGFGSDEYECKNTAESPKCFSIANSYCLMINHLASSAIEDGTKLGTAGIYARVMTLSTGGDSNFNLTTVWTGSGYGKASYFIYPGASYGWLFLREDTTTGSEAITDDYYTLKAYKLTFSGKVISRASSPITISSSLREGFMYYDVTPVSSTKGLFYFSSHYSPAYPLSCSILTISSSSVSMGTIANVNLNSERMDSGHQLASISNSSFLFNMCGYTNERYYSKALYYSGSVITDQTQIAEYEEQVQPTVSKTVAGIAKTQGTGGSATAHNEQVSVYVPNI